MFVNNGRNTSKRNEKSRFRHLVGKTASAGIQPLFLGQYQQPSKGQEKKNNSDEQGDEESEHKYKKAKEQLQQSQKQLLELSSIIHSLGTISIDYEKENTDTTRKKKSPSWTRFHRNETTTPRMTPQEVSATNLKRKIRTLHQEYERLQQENLAKDAMIQNLLRQQHYQPANKRQKITSNNRRLEPLGYSSSSMFTTSTRTETDVSSTSRMTMTSSSTSCISNVSSKEDEEAEDLSPLQEVLSLAGGRAIEDDHYDLNIGGVPIKIVEVKQEARQVEKSKPKLQHVQGKSGSEATTEAEIRKNFDIALQIIETQQYQIEMLMAQQNRRATKSAAVEKTEIDLIDAMHTKNIQNAREETKRKIRQLQNRD